METMSLETFEAFVRSEFTANADRALAMCRNWLMRGDGAAVYRNADLGHPECGAVKIVSFGSSTAQLEVPEPPTRLPDIGAEINWRYQLVAVCRP